MQELPHLLLILVAVAILGHFLLQCHLQRVAISTHICPVRHILRTEVVSVMSAPYLQHYAIKIFFLGLCVTPIVTNRVTIIVTIFIIIGLVYFVHYLG